ncbi:GTP-binding protein EngA [gamma proteobacterium HTCC5015]|nr:GTP-binding protein EngA [gamma proteobacterium HTCC5015]
MKPVIAIVGRPNVGKSTLFNCLTRTRDALVADMPGLTRDRKYGNGKLGDRAYVVVDTGGLSTDQDEMDNLMASQAQQAMDEADILLFMVDSREGINPIDENIAREIRKKGKPVFLVANKMDGCDPDVIRADFYQLGLGEPLTIAASHNRGVHSLIETLFETLPDHFDEEIPDKEHDDSVRIAVVGRPNVGKSTLINRILGETRVLAYDAPGTTRDSIFVPFESELGRYTLIDTAGVRKRGKIHETVEKFSVVKALQAIAEAHVVLQVIDARRGVAEQDLTLLREVLHQGSALVFVINKWDGLSPEERDFIKEDLSRRLNFISFPEFHFISALHGTGVGHILEAVNRAYDSAMIKLGTKQLTDVLEEATVAHQPPLVGRYRTKLRYAHQGGKNPPRIVVHGNRVEHLSNSYKRYLNNHFMKRLKLTGTPLHIEFRSGKNPYEGQKNQLSERQLQRRNRLIRDRKIKEKKRKGK